jgi:cytochrome c oxidase subunit 3
MAEAHAKHHDYHLVDPSPWPAVGAVAVFLTAVSAVRLFFEMKNPDTVHWGKWGLAFGALGIAYTMFMWWRDVIDEAEHQGHHTPVVQLHLRYGMLLFIASEVMFFVAWFWAYFDASLFADEAMQASRVAVTGGEWPPKGTRTFDPWHLPLVNTLILLTSGTTVTWAHHSLLHNDRQGLIWGLACTIVLGILFTSVQAYEYAHAAFAFSRDNGGNIYGSTFFMATGFHGFHVIVGTIFLIVCFFRALAGHFKPTQHFGFEAAAWYWHFVDVVWLFLFSCIYVWGAGPLAGH